MKRIFVMSALAFIGAANAFAADLPPPPPPPQAPAAYFAPVAVYNWAGIYVGLNGGYGFGHSDWTGGVVSSGSFSTSGLVVGGTAGVNFQTDQFVYGGETDLDYAPIHGNGPGGFCLNCQTSSTWLGTTRARAGFAWDRIMAYGTAGLAYGNVKASAFDTSNSSTELGWTAGAGVEAAIADNWTARLEYLYVDLKNGACSTACGSPPFATQSVSFTENLIRAGIDYKFRP